MGDTSSSAIIEQSRSGKRYELRDQVLQAVAMFPDCTSHEVAIHVLKVRGMDRRLHSMVMIDLVRAAVVVASVQKRMTDLLKLNYVEVASRRECEVTSYASSVYVVSATGNDYLASKGHRRGRTRVIASPDAIEGVGALTQTKAGVDVDIPPSKSEGRAGLAGLKAILSQ